MSGSARSALHRVTLLAGVALILLSAHVAAPIFLHGRAADAAIDTPSFAAQWNSIEPVVPNFWGPPVQHAQQEPYVEATGGTRTVQYFDKARMERTTDSGPVTNGLLTVELISGRRQMGDRAFASFAPSSLPVVGDPTNAWPPYAALGGSVFPARTARSGEPTGLVYRPDGTFGLNPGLAAQPGAAYGDYQADPGGTYAHNIPHAFSAYLAALPLPWQSAMGFPLTEAFWVSVAVNGVPTWVLVQPYERRVLSYTPANPAPFQVEMGNIGQHYYQWRYATTATTTTATTTTDGPATGTTGATVSGTPGPSGTPGALAIAAVQLGTVTDTTFTVSFTTPVAATSEILYGTGSHSYEFRQDIATTATRDHAVTLSGLQPGTKYYFALRVTAGGASLQRKEDYFATTSGAADSATSTSVTATKTTRPPTATATEKATATATATKPPSPTPTTTPLTIRSTLSQVVVGATSPAFLTPAVVQLDGTTAALSLADGASGGATGTAHLTAWSLDTAHATATAAVAPAPLSLVDRQTALTLTATLTIPFTDPTSPPLTVTFSRKLTPPEYTTLTTVSSGPLSNPHIPGYNVTLTFTLAIG